MKRLRFVVGALSAIGVSFACSGLTALACGGGVNAPQPSPSAPVQQPVKPQPVPKVSRRAPVSEKDKAKADLHMAKFRYGLGIATAEDMAILARHEVEKQMRRLSKAQKKEKKNQ